MKLHLHRGGLLVTISLGAVVATYLVFFFLPTKRKIDKLRAEMATKQTFVAQASTVASRTQQLQQQLADAQQYTQTWMGRPATSVGIAGLFGQIAKLSEQAGTTTISFSPQPLVQYDVLGEISLNLTCKGSYAQVLALLAGLEKLPQRIWFQDLKIERPDKDSENVKCEISLVIFAGNIEISG